MYVSTERDHPAYKPSFKRRLVKVTTDVGYKLLNDWLVVDEEAGYIIVADKDASNGRKRINGKIELCQ